jgi:hypothetical protein
MPHFFDIFTGNKDSLRKIILVLKVSKHIVMEQWLEMKNSGTKNLTAVD